MAKDQSVFELIANDLVEKLSAHGYIYEGLRSSWTEKRGTYKLNFSKSGEKVCITINEPD